MAWAALGLLVLHAVLAVVIDINMYADGAWFEFALAVGKPFHLVWRNYPTRLTPYLLEFLPAYGLSRAHVPLWLSLGVGHAIWQMAPALSLGACRALLPRAERAAALLPAVYFVLFGLLTWGFPTEVWLVAAFAWPAVLLYLHGPNTVGNAAAAGACVLGAVFSHEATVPLIPFFLLAGVVRVKDRPPLNAIGAVIAVGVSLGLWALAKLLIKPDAIIALSVGDNATRFFGWGALVGHQALTKYAAIALLAAAALGFAMLGRRLAIVAAGLLAIAGLAVVGWDLGVAGPARYQVRSICVLALAVLIALAIARRQWRELGTPLATPTPRLVLATALTLLAGVVIEQNARFTLAWVRYDRALSAAVNCSACKPGGMIDLPPEILHSPAAWSWGASFQSILRAKDLEAARVVRDDPDGGQPIQRGARARMVFAACGLARDIAAPRLACRLKPMPPVLPVPRFMPLGCDDAGRLSLDNARPRALQILSQRVCETPAWHPPPIPKD